MTLARGFIIIVYIMMVHHDIEGIMSCSKQQSHAFFNDFCVNMYVDVVHEPSSQLCNVCMTSNVTGICCCNTKKRNYCSSLSTNRLDYTGAETWDMASGTVVQTFRSLHRGQWME